MTASPLNPLYAAKITVLTRLKDFLYAHSPKQDIATFECELTELNLWRLLPYIDANQKVFFGTREGQQQFLGIRFLKTFSGAFATTQAQSLLEQNHDLCVFGGQRFHTETNKAPEWDDLDTHFYVLPQFLFVRDADIYKLKINIPSGTFNNKSSMMKLLLDTEALFAFKGHARGDLNFTTMELVPNFDLWANQIAAAKKAFAANELEKVVLSRKKVLSSQQSLKPDHLLETLNTRPGEHFIFHVQWRQDRSFTSLTPERLFSLNGDRLESDALAGTRPRGQTSEQDQILANELKTDQKELEEHRHVSRGVLATMQKLGASNACIKGEAESIMRLTHVQHLYTPMHGDLDQPQSINDLIRAFHPTAAVGGAPKYDACDWLIDNESYDRGYYAAPLGMIHATGADFCVGIRSALIHGKDLHIYAGAGIVAASDTEAEWQETFNKMKNFPFDVADNTDRTEVEHDSHPLM